MIKLVSSGMLFGLVALPTFAQTIGGTNFASLPAGAVPDAGSSILRVIGALLLVTAIFLGGVWLVRNWQRLAIRKGAAPKLNVLEVKSLGQRQALFVVGYQQQRMLLASSPAGVTLLSHLPGVEENTDEDEAPAPRVSFVDAFQQVLNGKR